MEGYHQISAFVASRQRNGFSNVAYSVYDNGELKVRRCVSMPGVSEHRGAIVGAWSAANYLMEHFPEHHADMYFRGKELPNELSAVWMSERDASDIEDGDKVECLLRVCCNIKSVAFDVCGVDDAAVLSDYATRMKELQEIIEN